jgi:hypothetical protein
VRTAAQQHIDAIVLQEVSGSDGDVLSVSDCSRWFECQILVQEVDVGERRRGVDRRKSA